MKLFSWVFWWQFHIQAEFPPVSYHKDLNNLMRAVVFGTIPSILIPLGNFGMELNFHADSTLGIGPATLISNSMELGGFHGDSDLIFSRSLMPNEREKRVERV